MTTALARRRRGRTGPGARPVTALNEEATVGAIVAEIRRSLMEAVPLVDE
ncbi:glucosyl-3-phosphoglycerate synthase, partial [Streptomyces albidoflavus]